MRKIIAFSVLLAFATTSFCQQVVQKHSLTKADYLQKSKKQKKTGSILLVGGAGLMITAFIIPRGELVHDGICVGWYCSDKYKNDGIKSAFFIAGGLAALASIPFFITSGKNKRRANAISASLKTDNASIVSGYSLTRINYPALSIKIALNSNYSH